jgi:oligopeptide transport system ATP-binding protein
MYLGKMVELCASDEIYAHPLHPYTQGLLDAVPIPSPALARAKKKSSVDGDIPSPIHPPSGCRFHTRCPHAKPECSEREPLLRDVGSGHFVACHLFD